MNQIQAYLSTKTFFWHRGEYPDMDKQLSGYFSPGTRNARPVWSERVLHTIELSTEEMLAYMLLKNMRSNNGSSLPSATYYEEVEE